MRQTQKTKLLQLWVERQAATPDKFFYPYEFIGELGTSDFIGYKAPARFSELCVAYPELIESKLEGKYRIGRLRFENSLEFLQTLPDDIKNVIVNTMKKNGLNYRHEEVIKIYHPETNTVEFIKKIVQ